LFKKDYCLSFCCESKQKFILKENKELY
jgi:hypothetical protein